MTKSELILTCSCRKQMTTIFFKKRSFDWKVNNKQMPSNFNFHATKFSPWYGSVFYEDRIIKPTDLRESIINQFHNGIGSELFLWFKLGLDIKKKHNQCVPCRCIRVWTSSWGMEFFVRTKELNWSWIPLDQQNTRLNILHFAVHSAEKQWSLACISKLLNWRSITI